MHLTELADKMDRKEKERIDELYKEVESGKEEFTPNEVFGSSTVAKMLNDKPISYYDSFDETGSKLPLNCLLYSRVLVNACPKCGCNFDPSLIEPYLERGVVLPILNANLAEYKPKFIDLVIQYPYIGSQTFDFLTDMSTDTAAVLCEHCYEKRWQGIFDKIAEQRLPRKEKKNVNRLLQRAQEQMSDPTERETVVLRQMEEAADRRDLTSLSSLAQKGVLVSRLRYPRVFDAIPQVNQSDLQNINIISKELGLPTDQAIHEIQEKELVVKGLNLDYNPKMPVAEYLDIILPRRKKINALIKELVERGSTDRLVSRTNDELWKINKDVIASKSLESLSFLTGLITDNLNIVASLLVGAFVGYSSAEFLGCGVGSAGGMVIGALGKKLSQRAGAKIPDIPQKTVEWMKTQLESPQEKILSLILSKDIKTIQVWQLRRRLGEK